MSNDAITAQFSPYQVDVIAGKTYRWCRCGKSKTQPFCDDTHVGSDVEPLQFVAERTETLNLCGCMESDDPPHCDGTHNIL